MDTFYIKQGDLWPPLEANLKQANGEAIPLQQSDTVQLILTLKNKRSLAILMENVDIVNHETAHVKYEWVDGDTDNAGEYQGEFIVLLDGIRPLKIPNNGYFDVIIDHKLGE